MQPRRLRHPGLLRAMRCCSTTSPLGMCVRVTGNLFRTADGRLAYIDFGMMGEIEPDVRRCPRSLEFGQKMWLVAQ